MISKLKLLAEKAKALFATKRRHVIAAGGALAAVGLLVAPMMMFALLCMGTLFAYLCRLDVLSYRTHRPAIVLMHVCFGAVAVSALWRSFDGSTGVLDVAAVLAAALWIAASYRDWTGVSVPEEYVSDRVPLHEHAGPTS